MKTTLTTIEVAEALRRDEYAAWTYSGARALAEYLEQYEQDTGEELELDLAAIRCDFSEYSSLADWAKDYFGGEAEAVKNFDCTVEKLNDGDADEKIRDYINGNGQLIEFTGGIIVSDF